MTNKERRFRNRAVPLRPVAGIPGPPKSNFAISNTETFLQSRISSAIRRVGRKKLSGEVRDLIFQMVAV